MSKQKVRVIVLHETPFRSWARDASTFALFVALILVGVALDSEAMQWAGAIIAFLAVLSRARGKAVHMSIPEARAFIDEIEAEGPSD